MHGSSHSRSFHGHMGGSGMSGEQSFGKSGAAFAGAKEMRAKQMLSLMVEYVWPKGNAKIRRTVGLAFGLLVGAKLLNISVPFFFKYAVDELNAITGNKLNMDSPETAAATAVFALLIGYGLARAGSSACNELRNAGFARVAQHSIRRIAQNVFKHLHNLDLVSNFQHIVFWFRLKVIDFITLQTFHLNRQTGALSKTIDRGSRGIATVLSALVFNVMPTIFELGLVGIRISCHRLFF